jgi:hypothetical protein
MPSKFLDMPALKIGHDDFYIMVCAGGYMCKHVFLQIKLYRAGNIDSKS